MHCTGSGLTSAVDYSLCFLHWDAPLLFAHFALAFSRALQLRLGPGLVTCMAQQGDQLLCGLTSGCLVSASLMRGKAGRAEGSGGANIREGLVLGTELLDESSDEEED